MRQEDFGCILKGNINCAALLNNRDEPVFRPDCCSIESPCGLKEGSCKEDGECMSTLVCGKDNCDREEGGKTNCCETKWEKGPGFLLILSRTIKRKKFYIYFCKSHLLFPLQLTAFGVAGSLLKIVGFVKVIR